MAVTGTVNGVSVHRPLLDLPKSQIYDFAHTFGVPYFKVRGKG
jgi:tRNA(Ile)-lysidine synthase TilS/MesJ